MEITEEVKTFIFTPKQKEVISWLLKGMTNQEIGAMMGGLSEKTVKAHLTQIYRILSVTSRTQCVLKLKETGR